jgi:hypothetical protein
MPPLNLAAHGAVDDAGHAAAATRTLLAGQGQFDDGGSAVMTLTYPPPLVPAGMTVNKRKRRSYSYNAPSVDATTHQMVKQTKTAIVAEEWGTWQVLVGGVDVTYFRAARTRMTGPVPSCARRA